MPGLCHKSIDILPEIWRQLRINAELSGCSVRDYLSLLIDQSKPVATNDTETQTHLARIAERNRMARENRSTATGTVNTQL